MGRVYEGVGEAWVAFNEGHNTRYCKNGKRVSFNGADLFSYTTVVARYKESEKGDKYVIATNRKYSVSTSSHISNCVGKCTVPVFYTYDIWVDDAMILGGMEINFNSHIHTAIKGWKRDWWDWSAYLCRMHREIVEFCQLTGLKHNLPPINEVCAKISMEREERKAAFDDPKAAAKRERDHARREAKKALQIAA